LEVLISIGILSIGLLATLALIPAGRTYMKKAAVDDRAAAIVPAAFSTISTLGLLGQNASSWWQAGNATTSETALNNEATVIRQLAAGGWAVTSTDTETITSYWPQDSAPQRVTGAAPPPSSGNTLTVTVTIANGSSSTNVNASVNQVTGGWSHTISPNPLPAPDMQIATSGPNVGQPNNTAYTDYTFTASYTNGTGAPASTAANPASFRQYGQRRRFDLRGGKAQATYEIPAAAVRINETADAATTIPNFPTFDSLAPPPGNRIWRRVASTVSAASVSRWTTGTREGTYSQNVSFTNVNNAPANPLAPTFASGDITADLGDRWTNGPNIEEDIDWYRFAVSKEDLITIAWSNSDGNLEANPFPVFLNTTATASATPLTAVTGMSTATSASYYIPADGFAVTRARVNPTRSNTTASYSVGFSRYRTGDRAVVIDPAMATRLDTVLPLRAAQRLNFAAFQQIYMPTGTPQPASIPRLNRDAFADLLAAGSVNQSLALSEYFFHAQDSIAFDPASSDDLAPTPLFDLTAANTPLRRRSEGKGSWMLMLEPQDPGPVSANWLSGNNFTASLVIFENRPLPPIVLNTKVSGEYAFSATWSDLEGTIVVAIPATVGLDEQDVRDVFRTGSWVLLAPATINETTAATQRFDWIRIQTAAISNSGNGNLTVTLLPESQPADEVLNAGLRAVQNQSALCVLAYEGVVAVVSRTVQIQP